MNNQTIKKGAFSYTVLKNGKLEKVKKEWVEIVGCFACGVGIAILAWLYFIII